MKKHKKGIFIGIVVVALLAVILPFLPSNTTQTNVSNKVESIDVLMLQQTGINTLKNGSSGSWEKLYFGGDGTFRWNILNPKETNFTNENKEQVNSILVVSDELYDMIAFGNNADSYKDSNLRKEEIALANKALSPIESDAVINTTQIGGDTLKAGNYNYIEPELVGDKFFAPTATIMNTKEYGLEDRHYRQEGNYFWMSSVDAKDPNIAGYISKCGVFSQVGKDVARVSLRATANINSDQILFIMAAKDSKNVSIGKESLQQITQKQLLDEFRLTIKDTSQTIQVTNIEQADAEIKFSFVSTGKANRLSAIVVDNKNSKILFYGQLADISESKEGQTSIVLPANFKKENCHLYVFSEQCNGDYKTDYASELIEVNVR